MQSPCISLTTRVGFQSDAPEGDDHVPDHTPLFFAPAILSGKPVARLTIPFVFMSRCSLPWRPPADSGAAMACALAALAAAGGPSGFDDPVDWQKESRVDRPLPGRAE